MSGQQRTHIPGKINVSDVITLTARLAQLLAEEVDLLAHMKISKIQDLQQEKLFLVNALEAHKKMVDRNPHLAETIPSQDKRELEGVVRVFEDILAENHRRLLRARDVNHKIVQSITQVVKESSQSGVYGAYGAPNNMGQAALSITLNQTA